MGAAIAQLSSTQIEIPATPTLIHGESSNAWVAGSDQSGGFLVLELDAISGSVKKKIPLQGHPTALRVREGIVWVAMSTASGSSIVGLEASSGEKKAEVALSFLPSALVVGHGYLWFGGFDTSLVRVTKTASGPKKSINVPSGNLALSETAVWSADTTGVLNELDPKSTEKKREAIPVGPNIVRMAAGFGYVWLLRQGSDGSFSLGRISQSNPEVDQRSTPLGAGPAALDLGADFVWVPQSGLEGDEGHVAKIDPLTALVVETVPVGLDPAAIAVIGNSVWVANFGSGSVTRIDS